MAKVWKEEDNVFLKENYLQYSNQELADMFKVTKKSIQGKLRRLGLHRKDDAVVEKDVVQEDVTEKEEIHEEESKPIFRKKQLNFAVPVVAPPTAPKAPYRPVEMTEKRKRAIREFDNAINILAGGDKMKATEEFNFIKDKFPREYDIVQKAQMWLNLINRPEEKSPESPEEYYMMGIRFSQQNKLDKAAGCFEQALKMDPEYLDAEYNIACIGCRRGDHEDAVEKLRALAEKDERFIEVATEDEDFEEIWENESFVQLALDYIDPEELEE